MAAEGTPGKLILAIVVLAAAAGVLVWRLTRSAEKPTVAAEWVCDSCGAEAALPFEPVSPDCAKCDAGQMVQRMFLKCAKCGTVFESYHKNWSSFKPRAEDLRAQADAVEPRASEHDDMQFLLRRPGGKWAWSGSKAGEAILERPRCPKCGPGPSKQFTRQLRRRTDEGTK